MKPDTDQDSRIDRRTVIKALGVGGIATLAGCTDGSSSPSGGTTPDDGTQAGAQAPSEPTGEVIVSQTYDPQSLDPAKYSNITDMQIANNIFDALVDYELGSATISPGLATDWTLQDEGTTLELTLKEGVQFHKGYGEMTADDVVAHFERMWSPNTGSPVKATLEQVGYQGVEKLGDYSARLNFSQPASAVPYLLGQQMGMIPSAEAVEEKGQEFAFDPVGAGQFQFESYEAQTRTELTAFEDYHGDLPNAERAIFRPIPEAQTAWSSFQAQEIDIKRVNSASRLNQLRNEAYVEIQEAVGLITRFVGINTTVEPFTDKRVRQALNYAANREELVEEVFSGLSQLAQSFMAPGVKHQVTEGVTRYPHDPEKAQQLLEEAGYPDGFETTWWVPPIGRFETPAEVFQESFSEVGIDVDVQIKENGVYIPKIIGGQEEGPHDVPLFIHSLGQDPIPDFFMYNSFHSSAVPPNGSNTWFYENEDVDAWLEEATNTTDESRRAELFANIERQVTEDAPGVWIDHEKFIFPTQDYINGFVSDPMRRIELDNAWANK